MIDWGRKGFRRRLGGLGSGFGAPRMRARLKAGLLAGAVMATMAVAGWQAASLADRNGALPSKAAIAQLQAVTFNGLAVPAGFASPKSVDIKVSRGESFEAAVRRAGLAAEEAREVVNTLGKAATYSIFDDLKAGQVVKVAVASPVDLSGPVRLLGLSMKTGPASSIEVSRAPDGGLKLNEMQEKVRDETKVACSEINGSLDESARNAGAQPGQIHQVVELFAHKLDFGRDIQPGDRFCMVFDRKVSESGVVVEGGDLRYAEIEADHLKGEGPIRFYRHLQPGSAKPQYFDELGKNIRGFLLRTPVDGARVTSRFGMRLHPLLGYTRMHQGIDFGAPTGTPVYAAGDGVVAEKRWAGGYGNWVKIRHPGGWETAYGHLSRWAPGLKPGQRVSQGQLIAYVGSTGSSTGPHLHYEVMQAGRKVDPKGAKVPSGSVLGGQELAAFKVEKAQIDALLAQAGNVQRAGAAVTKVAVR